MGKRVTAEMVKELREKTGVGMAKCKKALDGADGDIEQAIHILRKTGEASAEKKSTREANESIIGVSETNKMIALIEVSAETDFVIKNERFQKFLKNLCKTAVEQVPTSIDDFLTKSVSTKDAMTVEAYRAEVVQTLGENIQIKRLLVVPKTANCSYGVYSHMGGKIVVATEIEGAEDQEELARDIAMHVAAEAPEYVSHEDIPADVKAKEEAAAKESVKNKPPQMIEKIVQGKMKSYYDQACLLNQKYVKEPTMTVAEVIAKSAEFAKKPLKLVRFVRWQEGE